MTYVDQILPSKMVFNFELARMNIPLKYFGNEAEFDKSSLKESKVNKGKIVIEFSDYQFNNKNYK